MDARNVDWKYEVTVNKSTMMNKWIVVEGGGEKEGGSQLIRPIRQQLAMRRSTDTDGVIPYKPPHKSGAVGECVVRR
jgi:hypothetical protein